MICQEIPGSQNMPMMQSPAIFIALATVFRLPGVHGKHKMTYLETLLASKVHFVM